MKNELRFRFLIIWPPARGLAVASEQMRIELREGGAGNMESRDGNGTVFFGDLEDEGENKTGV